MVVTSKDRSVDYRKLGEWIDALVAAFTELGVAKGTRTGRRRAMGSRRSINGRGGLGRFLFGLAAVIVALPGEPFTRGDYVARTAKPGEEQWWACALYSECRQVRRKPDARSRCDQHNEDQPFSVKVVRKAEDF